MAEDPITPESYAKEWLAFAEMDLSSAEFLLAKWPQPIAIICYHCQQTAIENAKTVYTFVKPIVDCT